MNQNKLAKDSLNIRFLPGNDTLVIRKNPDSNVFIATSDSIIIGRGTFISIMHHLVEANVIPVEVLNGLTEEYYTE